MSQGLLFSGQGAQKVGMAKSLYDNEPAARKVFDTANETLEFDLLQACFEGPQEFLTETRVCQPALFVHGMAVHAILQERGLLTDVRCALGLSLGEITALTAAGVFDFVTGLKVVAERGRLMQLACDKTQGGMASIIGGSREDVAKLCEAFDVEMANLNCPGQIVISGEQAKIDAAVEGASGYGFRMVKPLVVAGAYHSRLMQPAADAFAEYLSGVTFNKPTMAVFTNTTGEAVSEPDAIRQALIKQVTGSVYWEDCMLNAIKLGVDEFYECGPGAVLAGLARRIDKTAKVKAIAELEDFPQ